MKVKIDNLIYKYFVHLIFLSAVILLVINLFIVAKHPEISGYLRQLIPVILGVGIFTALTRTKFYTDFFQRRIFDVFYNPSNHIDSDALKDKWKILTRAILREMDEKLCTHGTDEIFNRYIDIKTDYHYSDMEITFDIILKENNIVEIKQKIKNKIVVNPLIKTIEMKQTFASYGNHDSSCELIEVFLDGEKYDKEKFVTSKRNSNKNEEDVFNINIDTSSKKTLEIERFIAHKQNIMKDPIFSQEYNRFVQGVKVKYKAFGCLVYVQKIGYQDGLINDNDITKDAEGYNRITISSSEDLTLPGQGYIIVITSPDTNLNGG